MMKSGTKKDMSPAMQALAEVSDFARSKGLHGVMIMSPTCPDCGECHGFEMITDMDVRSADDDGINEGLAVLLRHFAKVAMKGASEIADTADAAANVNAPRH